jgi:hypothetical protein
VSSLFFPLELTESIIGDYFSSQVRPARVRRDGRERRDDVAIRGHNGFVDILNAAPIIFGLCNPLYSLFFPPERWVDFFF